MAGYIGNSLNNPLKIKEIYVGGSNNVPQKIIKGYVGDSNGIPQLIWSLSNNKKIYSSKYPNASIDEALTLAGNNGTRSPVYREHSGEAVAFISLNGMSAGWGGNWITTVCIALSQEEALLKEPSGQGGTNCHSYIINGVTYWVGLQASNGNYGGATQIVNNPENLPIFDDLYICEVNQSPTAQRVAELINILGIRA